MSSVSVVSCAGSSIRSAPSVVVAAVVGIAALPAGLVETFANHSGLTSAIPAKALGAYWLTFVAGGTVLMISGGISFCLYLRRTQPPVQERQ